MRIFLDEMELTGVSECRTLEEAFAAAREALSPTGRVVTGVLLDDEPLPEADFADASELDLSDAVIAFSTENRSELVSSTFTDLSDLLAQVRSLQQEIAASLDRGDHADAFAALSETLHLWTMISRTYIGAHEMMEQPVEQFAATHPVAARAIAGIAECLKSVKQSLASQDFAALSDCLGHEMDALAQDWQAAVAESAAALAAEPGGGQP